MWGAIARGVGGALVGEVAVNLALNNKGFNKDVKDTIKGTENSFSSSFKKIAKVIGSAFAVKQVWDFGKASVDAASQAQSAWTGLYSIVDGTGKSFADAKGFIEEYISDGLVPLSNATTAYKNLAARGYTTEQIENVMTRLKDAAAFGRQASYSLGDAITSATEGLKNENSILVDNAGVTKNVAKMWDEYAASIGTTANNLTQEQKIQAEVNGIMKETRFQVGDAAAYTNTFAGRTAQLSTAFLNLKTAVGKVIGPIASAFIPVLTTAMNAITKFMNKVQQLLSVFGFKWQEVITKNTSGIDGIGDSASSAADNIGSIGDSATKTAKQLKRSLGSMDELNILNTSNASGSAGGSGASGTGGTSGLGDSGLTGMFDNTITEDPISPQIQKIADKIKSYLEPLQSINLDNLKEAFNGLKESLQPITKKLFEGLDWLWFNILVPMAKWTVEDAVPAFINTISGALDLLNGVMDFAKPYLQFLWEEFLQPIAKWTGGIIVDVLNGIGNALSKVGKWLSENAPTIGGLRKELGPFADLIQEIGGALGNILGLAWGAFKTAVSAVWEYGLKPIWEYFLKPIFENWWSKLTGLAEVIGGIFEAFNKLMKGDWKGAGQSIVSGLVDGLADIWEGSFVKKYLFDPIVNGFKALFGIHSPSTVFEEFGKNIIEGLINGLTWAVEALWDGITYPFRKIYEFAAGLFGGEDAYTTGTGSSGSSHVGGGRKFGEQFIGAIIDGSTNKTPSLLEKVRGIGSNVMTTLSSSMENKKTTLSNTWERIKGWFPNITKTVDVKVGEYTSILRNKWDTLLSKFKGKTIEITPKINDAVGSAKTFANDIIGKINSKLPSFFPKIPRLAQGGWFAANNPQLAIVGDNTREPEIVTPESKIYDQVSQAIKDNGGAGKQQIELVLKVMYEDGKTIIQKVNQAQIDAGEVLLLT